MSEVEYKTESNKYNMSNVLSLVIPHELHNTDNHGACKSFMQQTADRIGNYFNDKMFITDFVAELEGVTEEGTKYEFNEYSFRVSIIDTWFYLNKGFWEIVPGFRYYHYFTKGTDQRIYLRDLCFDIVRTLGFKDGWICDEHYIGNIYTLNDDFNDFLKLNKGEVPEFKIEDTDIKNMWETRLYHDSYKECHELLHFYERKYHQFNIKTITAIKNDCILVSDHENKNFLLNTKTDTIAPFIFDDKNKI